jgi:hypothetical protein
MKKRVKSGWICCLTHTPSHTRMPHMDTGKQHGFEDAFLLFIKMVKN